MARELRRLLIEPARLAAAAEGGGRLPLQRQEHHYLSRVLRLRPGAALAVIDGCGGLWQARCGEGAWLQSLQACGQPLPPPLPCLTLALALPRQDVDLVWRMATELGIDRLQPLRGERSQDPSRRLPQDRWSAVVREATEQCERLWLPVLEPLQPAIEWLAANPGPAALLATTRREGLPTLETVLGQLSITGPQPRRISLAIGPEGGWSPGEQQRAEAAGWRAVSLGDTILRSSTAAVAGVSRLVAWRQLSGTECP